MSTPCSYACLSTHIFAEIRQGSQSAGGKERLGADCRSPGDHLLALTPTRRSGSTIRPTGHLPLPEPADAGESLWFALRAFFLRSVIKSEDEIGGAARVGISTYRRCAGAGVRERRSCALARRRGAGPQLLGSPPTPAAARRICSKLSPPASESETICEHEMLGGLLPGCGSGVVETSGHPARRLENK